MDEIKFNFLYKGEKSLIKFVDKSPSIIGKWNGWVGIDGVEFFIENRSFRAIIWMVIVAVKDKEVFITLNLYRKSKKFYVRNVEYPVYLF